MISVVPLPPGVSVVEVPAPTLPSADTLSRIDAIWQEERERRGGRVTNGRIFSVSHRDGATFKVWQSQYKWWIAQRRDPTLFQTLALRPLAVSGVMRLAEGLVFARRAAGNTQDPGMWELAPSGGVDQSCRRHDGTIAAAEQILVEAEEELAIPRDAFVVPPEPIAVMEDGEDHVVDIVFELRPGFSAMQLEGRFAAMTNREYTDLRIASAKNFSAMIVREGGRISAASQALLDHIAKC